jgi:hypothetical protein
LQQRFRVKVTDRSAILEGSQSDNEGSFSRTLRRRELRGIAKPEHPVTDEDKSLHKMQRLNSLKQLSSGTYGGLKINGSVKKKRRSSSSESHTLVAENNHRGHSEVSGGVPRALAKSSAYSKDDSHVLRSRTASSPRVKPYVVNHKVVDKAS